MKLQPEQALEPTEVLLLSVPFSTRTHLSCRSLHLCFSASQTDTSNSRKTFVLSITQLGSPASLAQHGFFINKGVSHIKDYMALSLFFLFFFTHFEANSQSSNNTESIFTFSSYFLFAGSSQRHQKKKGCQCFSVSCSLSRRVASFQWITARSRRVLNSVFPSSSSMSDGSDSEDTCPEPPLTERERGKKTEGRGREAHCLMGETHNKATNLQRLSLIVTGQEVPCY